MTWPRLEQLAPLTGVLAVVLVAVGGIIARSGGPDDDAPATEWVAFYDDKGLTIFLGSGLLGVGVAAFVWFLGSLRDLLRSAEGGTGSLSAVSFGAGVGTAVLFMATAAPGLAGAAAFGYIGRDLSPEATEVLTVLEDGFYITSFYFAFAFLAPTAVAIVRTRVLPVWLGWATLAVGVLLLSPIGWIVIILGLAPWILVVSVLLYLRGRGAGLRGVHVGRRQRPPGRAVI